MRSRRCGVQRTARAICSRPKKPASAANNLDEDSTERKQIEKSLKKIGEKEGRVTIAFGDAGETDGVSNLGITNPVTNTITFNMDAINSFTSSNPYIASGESNAAGFFTGVIGHEGADR